MYRLPGLKMLSCDGTSRAFRSTITYDKENKRTQAAKSIMQGLEVRTEDIFNDTGDFF